MSIAISDEGVFHVDVAHITSTLKLGFQRGGVLRIEMANDMSRVDLSPAEAEALGRWILEQGKKES